MRIKEQETRLTLHEHDDDDDDDDDDEMWTHPACSPFCNGGCFAELNELGLKFYQLPQPSVLVLWCSVHNIYVYILIRQ